MAAKGHSHDHHDHSNCNHDHDHNHNHGSGNATQEQLEKVNSKQQEADKLAKNLVELNALANEYKKKTSVTAKPSPAVIAKSDVDLLVNEMGLTKAEAESALKNNEGDAVAALNYLIAH